MSAPIPSIEPTRFFAGETVQWTRAFGDFPASSWALKYTIVGASNLTVTATADGDGFAITIPLSSTETMTVGNYRLVGYVQDDPDTPTERHQVYEGQLEILFNPAFQGDGQEGVETRSFWRRVRDHLRDIIEGKSQQSKSSYSIAGRSVTNMTWQEILDAYDRASTIVSQEEEQEAAARGEDTGQVLRWKFQRP